MAVKRGRKIPKKVSKAFEQALAAEGAPVALDLLGFGSTVGDLIRGKSRKAAAKPRAKKKVRAKPRAKAKKPAAKKSRRK